ncbi:hypothetical protein, partial [Prevotella disiens]
MKNIQFVLIVVMVLYACSRQNIYKDIVGTCETFKIRKMKNIQFVLIVVMVLYACSRQNIYKDIVGT